MSQFRNALGAVIEFVALFVWYWPLTLPLVAGFTVLVALTVHMARRPEPVSPPEPTPATHSRPWVTITIGARP